MKATRAQRQIAKNFFSGKDEERRYGRPVVITEKNAESWALRKLFVSRVFHPVDKDGRTMSIAYHEAITIGPRGGIQTIYRNVI
jgi:hypothetical protein